ncbi:MAG: histidinol dehydrogenase [Alphaproteobacteria bacterium]|nr:histidinol dehydrogenase [Alphaproteobacteria bacterium]
MTLKIDIRDNDFEKRFQSFLNAKRENAPDVAATVSEILENVRKNGDKAVLEYTAKFDRLNLTAETMRISVEEIENAVASCNKETLDALYLAAERIEAFHDKQTPESHFFNDETGALMGWRWTPVMAAGLYVPGGTAAYPSSVLMNAIPAKVAGVQRIVMVVPCPDGKINPLVLAAADCVGIEEIYRIGGAQAIGALAHGTETIKPVDMIVGPGNAFVAAAKRQVFGRVGIDMIAGPSEILVIADKTAKPEWTAADLLSQAEHDVSARSVLITDNADFANEVNTEIEKQLKTLDRKAIARKSWEDNGAIILVENLKGQAGALADRIAPEHLELSVENPEELCRHVHHAGSIFLGHHTPEAVGDYIGGPNHVLPTARSARFSSGLGVQSFMKRTTILSCTDKTLKEIGKAAVLLGQAEGLTAHAASVQKRLSK